MDLVAAAAGPSDAGLAAPPITGTPTTTAEVTPPTGPETAPIAAVVPPVDPIDVPAGDATIALEAAGRDDLATDLDLGSANGAAGPDAELKPDAPSQRHRR
jgi:hypothetical protein